MRIPVLLPCLLLAASVACLAPKRKAEFEANLQRWVGQPVAAFIQANGAPSRSEDRPDGGKTYAFSSFRQESSSLAYKRYTNYTTGEQTTVGAGQPDPTKTADGTQVIRSKAAPVTLTSNLYCRVFLETDAKGIILATRYEGNDCW